MRFVIVFVLSLGLVACGGGDNDDGPGDAGEWSVANMETLLRGQWARAWEQLHPDHQAHIARDLYIECNSDRSFPDLEVEVDEVFEEEINVPELGEIETTAVTMVLSSGDSSEFVTRHLVEHEGEWTWITTQDAIDAYSAGECP